MKQPQDRGGTAVHGLPTAPRHQPATGEGGGDEEWASFFKRACRHLDAPILRREDRRMLQRIERRLRRRSAYRLACRRPEN